MSLNHDGGDVSKATSCVGRVVYLLHRLLVNAPNEILVESREGLRSGSSLSSLALETANALLSPLSSPID